MRLPWLLARADVIVIDDYQPVIYRVDDPDVRIIQLWHAWGAFKTVGYSRVGKPGGPSPYSRVHKNYTHAIVSSEHDVPFYAEAFGIPEARVVPTGIPRMDRFFDPAAREARSRGGRTRRSRRRAAGRRSCSPRRSAATAAKTRDVRRRRCSTTRRCTRCASRRTRCVIIRMHPFVREPLDIPEAFRDRIVDGSTAGASTSTTCCSRSTC